jgi:hypothetical protein
LIEKLTKAVENRYSRRSHKPSSVGSTPTPATNNFLKKDGRCPYSGQVCILKTCAGCWVEANADLFERGRQTVMPLGEFARRDR